MVDEGTIYDGMSEIFADVFMRDDIVLSPTLTAKDIAGWDSFRQLEIIMATEQRFSMRFTSAEVDGFRALGELVEVVARRASLG